MSTTHGRRSDAQRLTDQLAAEIGRTGVHLFRLSNSVFARVVAASDHYVRAVDNYVSQGDAESAARLRGAAAGVLRARGIAVQPHAEPQAQPRRRGR
jgi:hypothetical protein